MYFLTERMNYGERKKATNPDVGMVTRFLLKTKAIPKEMLPISVQHPDLA